MLHTTQTLRRVGAAGSRARSVQCNAGMVRPDQAALGRRAMLMGTAAPLLFTLASPALALILDEEDEELVEKAKANRRNRLAEQRTTTREFLKAEGLKDVKLDQELIPIQRGINKLAESGSMLEGGDVKAASNILNQGWSAEFINASSKVGSATDALSTKLQALQAAAGKGDARTSKAAYVELVAEVQSWSAASGLSSRLTGI